ncbi:MAG: hypothetical protein AAFR65_02770 [Pseudomonadota bacterium]
MVAIRFFFGLLIVGENDYVHRFKIRELIKSRDVYALNRRLAAAVENASDRHVAVIVVVFMVVVMFRVIVLIVIMIMIMIIVVAIVVMTLIMVTKTAIIVGANFLDTSG